MAFVEPTPADIKLDFPAFAAVDDTIIQRRIDRTAIYVDQYWLETDYTWAKELLTAHWLQTEGLGTSGQAATFAANGVTRFKSGDLDVALSDTAGANAGEFSGSVYGRQFAALLRKNKGGPYVASAGGNCGIADHATDAPWAWRYRGYGL